MDTGWFGKIMYMNPLSNPDPLESGYFPVLDWTSDQNTK